jgi:hypothetical protein
MWNHRVVKATGYLDPQTETFIPYLEPMYEIKEVYYDEETKTPHSFCNAFTSSETLEGLNQVHKWMMDAFKHPVLFFDGTTLAVTDEIYTPKKGKKK